MNKKFIFLGIGILFMAFVMGITLVEDRHGVAMGTGIGWNLELGLLLEANDDIVLNFMNKTSTTSATECYVRDAGLNLLSTASFSGQICNLGNVTIANGDRFYVTLNKSTGTWTRNFAASGGGYPFAGTNVDFVAGYDTGAGNHTTFVYDPMAITTYFPTTELTHPSNNSFIIDENQQFNATIIAGSLQNATLYIWKDATTFLTENKTISGDINYTSFTLNLTSIGNFEWNMHSCGSVVGCTMAESNYTFFFGYRENITYDNSTYETKVIDFEDTITFAQSLGNYTITDAFFIYNGTSYDASFTGVNATTWTLSKSFEIPDDIGDMDFNFNVTINSTASLELTEYTQEVNGTVWGLCNSTLTKAFYNITFKNETIAEEDVTATLSSSWIVYLGTGLFNKSFSISNSSENLNYSFCAVPNDASYNVDYSITYGNSESQQRTFAPVVTGFPIAGTLKTFYLLPTSQGIFVTFQIIDVTEQPVQGALVTLSRAGYGDITSQSTGDAGTVTFFLDPTIPYTVTVEADRYTTYTTTDVFTQTSYTINLGGTTGGIPDDLGEGISYSLSPMLDVLANNTLYVFNFTISSDILSLDEYGFVLFNATGGTLGSDSGVAGGGGTATVNFDTGNQTGIVMNAYWVVGGNYTNVSRSWIIVADYDTSFSIFQFFQDLNTYLAVGMFGLDNFGLRVIIFLSIFIFTGVLSYKFGLNSPAALLGIVFAGVAFFDVAIGIMPNPIGAVPFFPTIVIGLITVAVVIKEGFR